MASAHGPGASYDRWATAMHVTVDLFSGRPNPEFDLDPHEAEHVLELLASLAAAPGRSAEPPPLGYRGFVVETGGGTRLHVFHGLVIDSRGTHEDPDRRLERLLLESARRHLGPDAVPERWVEP
jgi:hypothetical protein